MKRVEQKDRFGENGKVASGDFSSFHFHLLRMAAAPFLPQLYPSSEHTPVICQPPAEKMPALICSANHSPDLTGMSPW